MNEETKLLINNSLERINSHRLYDNKERVIQRIKDLHKMKIWAMQFFGNGYENVCIIDAELFAFRQKLFELNKKVI